MFNYKKGQRYIHVSQLIVFPYFFISFCFVEPQIETILGGGGSRKHILELNDLFTFAIHLFINILFLANFASVES